MKVDVTKEIVGPGNEPVKDVEGTVWTYRAAFGTVLSTELNISGEEKYKRGKLAGLIFDNDEVELSLDEAKLLKDLVGKAFSSSIVVPVWDLLDPKESEDG